jgi:lysophospholipase L1-like esterase
VKFSLRQLQERISKGCRDIGKNLVFSFIAIVVFFGILELATRVVSYIGGNGFFLALHELDPYDREIEDIYQWHPSIGFTFRPGIRFLGSHPAQKEKAVIRVDNHGFLAERDDLTYEKKPDEIRIAAIGASTTANVALEFHENWPGCLEHLVQEKIPGKKIRVINAAVPGYDTSQSIPNLALRVMPFHPDVVIIYHAYNDLKAAQPNFMPDYSHIHPTAFGYYEKPGVIVRGLNHSMAYVRLRNKYREYKMMSEGISNLSAAVEGRGRANAVPSEVKDVFEQHMRSLVGIARAGDAKVILSSFATLHDPRADYSDETVLSSLSERKKTELILLLHFTPGLTREGILGGLVNYNEVLENVATKEKTGWVDNANLVPHDDKYFLDRVHFSREGARLMAENFLPVVLNQLGVKEGGRKVNP